MRDLLPLTPSSSRSSRILRTTLALAIISITSISVGSCTDSSTPTDENRLIVIDGIEICFDELQPYSDFLDRFRPELGKKTKYIWAMREHILPLKVAQRAFAKERTEQLALAQGLCSVATNIIELAERSSLIQQKRRSNLTRSNSQLPVAMFLFDQTRVGSVSPPLEVPQGYFVVSSYNMSESPLVMADFVDALQVGFVTHTSKEWHDWWESQQQVIGDKVTFVHPDYRDDFPKWVKIPKDQQP